jgi:Carboxypeptidase regulatory-like domain
MMGRILVLVLVVCVIATGQSNFAAISGKVEDPSHAPVESARITVRAKDTGAVRTLTANADGMFEVVNLLPGDYSVNVDASGFSQLTRGVTLEVGQNMGLDLVLNLGEQHESLGVSAAAETLKTQDASLGEVVDQRSVQDLPLNGRMLLDLALTVPGAHAGHGAQTGNMNPLYWRPGQASAISIGGNRPNANYFLLDGVTNTDPTFNTQNFSASPDAVREFQV